MESLAQRRHLHRVSLNPYYLLTLFSGLVTMLVSLIIGLFLGFLVMIVKIAGNSACDRTHGQTTPVFSVMLDG